ncbi:MAG: 30S ribosomal protein S7 [Desulfobacterales bacterium]|nr:30S ribosomal protein S7 [Desulfobacterales bacterium]
MPRRREIAERKLPPDLKYNSELVARFINYIMRDGKKSVAQSIVYDALDYMGQKSGDDPMKLFEQAIGNIRPQIEVKSRRVGGSTYQVPTEIRPKRQTALALRWIIAYSGKRSENTMARKVAGELMDALEHRGASVKKREDTHRMAEANKAFAHYRW